MPRLAILPMLLTCLALAFPALAKDASGAEAIVKPDPPGAWHEVHYDRSTTKCASSTATPLCAIDTTLRCFVLEDRELCNEALFVHYKEGEIFQQVPWKEGMLPPSMVDKNIFFRYRVLASRYLRASDIAPEEIKKLGPLAGKPGDLELTIDRRDCNADLKPACPRRLPGQPPYAYTLRQIDGQWLVVNWSYPRDFEGSYDYRK